MTNNPPRRTALTALFIAFIAIIMIFAPEFVGIDGFDGGFAISVVSLLIGCVAVVVAIFYFSLAGKLDRILRGEGLLAHWTYTPEQWTEYSQKEYMEEKSEKKGIFLIITAFALFFGILFWVFDHEAGFYVFLTMVGLIALVAFTWQFSAWHNYRQNRGGVREAYIAKDGIYMNRKFIS
jgi:MFS family permease